MVTVKIIPPGEDFSDALKIRFPVFVKEQNVPEEHELDEHDKQSYHAVLYENEIPVACGRLYFTDNIAHIGRVAVLKDYRRKGYATTVCRKLMDIAVVLKADIITLDAQKYVVDLYEKLGFNVKGKEFLDENIPHLKMIKVIRTPIFNIICIAVSIISWIVCIIFFSTWKNSNLFLDDVFALIIVPTTLFIGVVYIFIYSVFIIKVIYNLIYNLIKRKRNWIIPLLTIISYMSFMIVSYILMTHC